MHLFACFHPGLHTLNPRRVFEYSCQLRRNEKYDVYRKINDSINPAFTKSSVLYLYDENKIAFYLNKGCFIAPLNRRFRFKKGVSFVPNPRCFPNLCTSMVHVYAFVGSVCVSCCVVCVSVFGGVKSVIMQDMMTHLHNYIYIDVSITGLICNK